MTMDIELIGTAVSLRQAVGTLEALCQDSGYTRKRIDEIISAVAEALSNALRHGNAGEEGRPIRLRARTEGPALYVEVEDAGEGLRTVPPLPDLSRKLAGQDRPTGWGLYLMRSLASDVSFAPRTPGGTKVRMRFDPVAPAGPVGIRLLGGDGHPLPSGDSVDDTT